MNRAMASEIDSLRIKVSALIDRLAGGERDDRQRDALLCEALSRQAETVEPYRRLVKNRLSAGGRPPQSVEEWPALPTDVFRFSRVASHPAEEDVRVFLTSGTTATPRGRLHLRDLSFYDRAARAAARHALFPDLKMMRLIILAPSAEEAPDSSLSYMLSRFVEWFGAPGSLHVWRHGRLDIDALKAALDEAVRALQPAALLGVSFAFVHAEDAFGARRWALPGSSRIMLTGGFKSRSREVDGQQLADALRDRYGISADYIVQEYGMTELCSQMYQTTLREAIERKSTGAKSLWAPGWVRCSIADAKTLAPVRGDAVGLVRVDDLANLDTICAVQTSDLGRMVGGGIELIGRAPEAVARGCSLAMEEALDR